MGLVVFFLSAFLHEYVISIPLNIFKAYGFLGMMFQAPLMFISNAAETKIGPIAGNIIVWLSLIIGHPIGILIYYNDFFYLRFSILYYHSTIMLLKPLLELRGPRL